MLALLRTVLGDLRRPGLKEMSLLTLRETPRQRCEAAIRKLCATAPMADGMTLCRVLGRYKLFVDNADFGLSAHLMLDGFWEMWVTRAMLRMVKPGMVAVDVGANIGYYTVLLADLVGPGGHVHAFEPNPRTMRLLARSLPLNVEPDRVTLHPEPLAATSGQPVRLVVPEGEPKNAHLSAITPAYRHVAHDLRSAALDDVIGDGPVDFVKIDAEGAERAIWDGMQRLVARGQPLTIVMEFAASRYAAPEAFLAEIAQRGFRLSRIEPRGGVVHVSARDILRAPADRDQMLAFSRPWVERVGVSTRRHRLPDQPLPHPLPQGEGGRKARIPLPLREGIGEG